jgi:SAM-dependent methyltransferase
VGQESFMRADEILRLARYAGVCADASVLDVCCGIAGPGRHIVAEFGCRYLGVDYSASAIEIARSLAGDLNCRFEQMQVPPLPDGRFDVVLILETLLAFRDKISLFDEVSRVLRPGGRLAFTLEEGCPLTPTETSAMPDADTVWLVELPSVLAALRDVGLSVRATEECTAAHLATATALLQAYRARSAEIAAQIGWRALTELLAAHQLWSEWLGSGRVRKFACIAERR